MLRDYDPGAQCPLDDVRVLDLSRLVAGNMLTQVLADFGAEVIKIERPGRGDTLRDWRVKGISIYWKVYGRNKKSVTLNLQHERGRELLLDLVRTGHVLVESFRPGTLERMGLGPERLLEVNPKLVIIRVSGWGQTGPYAHRPGFGTLVEAMSGFAAMNGFEDRPPVLPPFSMADMYAGLYGASAALIALRHAESEGGRGQVIDVSLLEPMISVLGPLAGVYRLTGTTKKRTGSRSQTAAPRNVYGTRDGKWLAISASTQDMTAKLLRVLGLEHLIDDPRFKTNADRLAHVDELDELIGARIRERTLEENLRLFDEVGVTGAPVYSTDQLVEDPHVKGREIIVELPDKDMGRVPMHNVVARLSETPGAIRHPAPELGEHNEEILGALGLSPADVEALRSEGVI